MPHHHDHNHSHEHHHSDLGKEKKAFYIALFIAFFFMIVEIIGSMFANSLALISDALHLFTDVGALFLGLIVIAIQRRPFSVKKSYGYQRAEVLGALASGVTLWVLMILLVYEGVLRLFHPPEVKGPIVFVIAAIGLIANFSMMKILHPGHDGSLNLKAAYMHLISDLLGSIGVILSGIIIWATDFYPIDPIITFLLAILIFRSSGQMMLQALDILMESTPPGVDPLQIEKDLKAIPGVMEVHDLHVWSLSSKKKALSVHLVVKGSSSHVLREAHHIITKEHGIPHITIQIEDPEHFEKKYCYDCSAERK